MKWDTAIITSLYHTKRTVKAHRIHTMYSDRSAVWKYCNASLKEIKGVCPGRSLKSPAYKNCKIGTILNNTVADKSIKTR